MVCMLRKSKDGKEEIKRDLERRNPTFMVSNEAYFLQHKGMWKFNQTKVNKKVNRLRKGGYYVATRNKVESSRGLHGSLFVGKYAHLMDS